MAKSSKEQIQHVAAFEIENPYADKREERKQKPSFMNRFFNKIARIQYTNEGQSRVSRALEVLKNSASNSNQA